jgi:Chaperone of endosialidase
MVTRNLILALILLAASALARAQYYPYFYPGGTASSTAAPIQYNSSGGPVLGGSSNFTFNPSTGRMSLTGSATVLANLLNSNSAATILGLEDGQSGNALWTLQSGSPLAGDFLLYDNTTLKVGMEADGAGRVYFPNISSATGVTSGYVCFTSSTGALSYDPTNTCLVSSEAYKTDVANLNGGLTEIERLRPVSFRYLPKYDPARLGAQVGFLAEEVAAVDPRLASYDPNTHAARAVQYDRVSVVLVAALQEQQREIRAIFLCLGALACWMAVYLIHGALTRIRG